MAEARQIDERLLAYCTSPRQKELVEAAIQHGSVNAGSRAINMDQRQARRMLKIVEGRAAKSGFAPDHDMTRTVPDGFRVKGVSSLYNKDGQLAAQWVKSDIDRDRQLEIMREAVEAFKSEIPLAEVTEWTAPDQDENLLTAYIITDYHIGMYAWAEETGDDPWDTKIAEKLLMAWFDKAIALTPPSRIGVFAQIGDFLHWDGMDAVTPASKHLLDADTRFQRLARVVIRLLRYCVSKLLQKHEKVHLIMADANHDPASEIWLRELLAAFYDDEPRITVDNSADTYYCIEHGTTSLFFHHGHKRKPENIDDVFVAKFREVFGRTKHSYAHMGHMHHNYMKETNLMIVEQHRTLASKDAYASRGGYMSGRDAKAITYHKNYGEVSRLTISPDMLK